MRNPKLITWFIGIIAIIAIWGLVYHARDETQPDTTHSYLDTTHAVLVPNKVARAQIKAMIDLTARCQSSEIQLIQGRESQRTQVRSFNITILIGLFSAIVLIKYNEVKAKIFNEAITIIAFSAIVFCGIMYFLDIHIMDLSQRYVVSNSDLLYNTMKQLLQLKPDDCRWYTIDFHNLTPPNIGDIWVRIPREICHALSPNLDQVLYFLAPLILLLFVANHRIIAKT